MITNIIRKSKKKIITCIICILSATMLTGFFAYGYFQKKQTYVAETNIKFVNSDAKNGYAYDGSKIDEVIKEITGAEVLDKAIQLTGASITANRLSGQLSIEEVIPPEEQEKKQSALDNGKEYEYNVVEYKVSIHSDLPEAGKLLNNVARSFMEYYSDKHMNTEVFPSDCSTLNTGDYDYIEIADLILNNIDSMEYYLDSKDSDYHCSTSGYSFSDIHTLYDTVYNSDLPQLYSAILTNKASKNVDLLLNKLDQNNAKMQNTTDEKQDKLDRIVSLIKSYSEKNKSDGSITDGDVGNSTDNNHTNIIQDVYENDHNPESTYDQLFSTYNSDRDEQSGNSININYNDYLKSVFKDAKENTSTETKTKIENLISKIMDELHENYQLAEEAKNEYNEVQSAGVIQQLNTPVAQKQINVKMYTLLLMVAMFLVLVVAIPVLWILKKNLNAYQAHFFS